MNFDLDTIQITGYQLTVGSIVQSALSPPIINLTLDNVTMQQVGFDNVITQQPTTRGTPISDNIYRLPIKYQIDGLLSPSTSGNILGIPDFLGYFTSLSTRFSNIQTASLNTYIFNVTTGFASFQSMGLLSCVLKQDPSAFNALRYTMLFQETIMAPSSANQTSNNYNRQPANRGKVNV